MAESIIADPGHSAEWLDQIDRIDPFFGDPDKLADLLASAPTSKAAAWLSAQIDSNHQFISRLGFP